MTITEMQMRGMVEEAIHIRETIERYRVKEYGVVYALLEDGTPNVVHYVGSTYINPEKRFRNHRSHALVTHQPQPVCGWIRKLTATGGKVVMRTLLQRVEIMELGEHEDLMIREFLECWAPIEECSRHRNYANYNGKRK